MLTSEIGYLRSHGAKMSLEIRYAKSALDDFNRVYEFLDKVDPSAAIRAVEKIYTSIGDLKKHPGLGRPYDLSRDVRELIVSFSKTAYVVRYQENNDSVVILRIWHSREMRA